MVMDHRNRTISARIKNLVIPVSSESISIHNDVKLDPQTQQTLHFNGSVVQHFSVGYSLFIGALRMVRSLIEQQSRGFESVTIGQDDGSPGVVQQRFHIPFVALCRVSFQRPQQVDLFWVGHMMAAVGSPAPQVARPHVIGQCESVWRDRLFGLTVY